MTENPVREKIRELERDLAELRRCPEAEALDLTALDDSGIGRELRGLRGIGDLIAMSEEIPNGQTSEDVGIAIVALAESAWDRVCELSYVVPYRHTEAEE